MGLRHRSFGMHGMVCALIVPKLQAWVLDISPSEGKAWWVGALCQNKARQRVCLVPKLHAWYLLKSKHGVPFVPKFQSSVYDISPSEGKTWRVSCAKIPSIDLRHPFSNHCHNSLRQWLALKWQ